MCAVASVPFLAAQLRKDSTLTLPWQLWEKLVFFFISNKPYLSFFSHTERFFRICSLHVSFLHSSRCFVFGKDKKKVCFLNLNLQIKKCRWYFIFKPNQNICFYFYVLSLLLFKAVRSCFAKKKKKVKLTSCKNYILYQQ